MYSLLLFVIFILAFFIFFIVLTNKTESLTKYKGIKNLNTEILVNQTDISNYHKFQECNFELISIKKQNNELDKEIDSLQTEIDLLEVQERDLIHQRNEIQNSKYARRVKTLSLDGGYILLYILLMLKHKKKIFRPKI